MRFLLTLWMLVSVALLVVGCSIGIHAEGCDVLDIEIEGSRDASPLPGLRPP